MIQTEKNIQSWTKNIFPFIDDMSLTEQQSLVVTCSNMEQDYIFFKPDSLFFYQEYKKFVSKNEHPYDRTTPLERLDSKGMYDHNKAVDSAKKMMSIEELGRQKKFEIGGESILLAVTRVTKAIERSRAEIQKEIDYFKKALVETKPKLMNQEIKQGDLMILARMIQDVQKVDNSMSAAEKTALNAFEAWMP